MDQNHSDRTLLFADVCNSTRLYDELGNDRAQQLIADVLDHAGSAVRQFGGRVVKTIGDELMCSFPEAGQAVRAAMAIQEELAEGGDTPDTDVWTELHMRIGLQHGPVIEENGDLFGDAVNVASRMTQLAKGGQILTTESTIVQLPDDLRPGVRQLDTIQVKGKAEPVNLFEVVWQEDDVTRIMSGLFDVQQIQATLTLRFETETFVLTHTSPPLLMGRTHKADVAVEDTRVSRHHATISFRRDKFVLTDQSTNGTHVEIEGEMHYIRREETELVRRGRISLGRAFDDEACRPLEFSCRVGAIADS